MFQPSPHRAPRRSFFPHVVATLTAALAVLGCGDDGGGGAASTGEASGGSGTTADVPVTTESTSQDSSSADDQSTTVAEPTLLERVIAALGGDDALQGMETILVEASGQRWVEDEGYTPGELPLGDEYTMDLTLDIPGAGIRADFERTIQFQLFAGTMVAHQEIAVGDQGAVLGMDSAFTGPRPLSSARLAALRKRAWLLNPHLRLREAITDPGLASEDGTEPIDGVSYDVLVLSDAVADIRLLIDPETDRIARLRTMENGQYRRDTPLEVVYEDWQDAGGLLFPMDVELRFDALVLQSETRAAVTINPELPADTFVLPDEVTTPDPDATAHGNETHQFYHTFLSLGFTVDEVAEEITGNELAPGVFHLVGDNENSLVVEQEDRVIVMEAMAGPERSDSVMAWVGANIPGKPVTHVVQSHHHQDHSSGVRQFVANDATLVVGEGAVTLWDDILAAPSTVRPDALSMTDVVPVIEEVPTAQSLLLDDPSRPVEVLHIDDEAHAADMLMVVVDDGSTHWVFVADLYNPLAGTITAGGPISMLAGLQMYGFLDASCQSPTPVVLVGAHGGVEPIPDALVSIEGLGFDLRPIGC